MVTCHIASLPDREQSLKLVLDAITPQVDRVYVMLNGHERPPQFIYKYSNVWYELLDNSLGDAAKFLKVNNQEGICAFLDDDLIVPNGYIRDLHVGLQKYGGVVSLHGKLYPSRATHYKGFVGNFRCLNTVKYDVRVDVIGTGCMMYDNREVKVDLSDFPYRNMADLLFSKICHERDISMTVLAHRYGYLKYCPPKSTIWNTTKDYSKHNEILQSFLK